MTTKQAHQPTSNPTRNSWMWTAAAGALPQGLPSGALTVIRIHSSDTSDRGWDNTVTDLVRTTLASGRPVGYVPVDSDDPHQAIAKAAMRTEDEGGRLGILLDEDHLVYVRDDRGRPRAYGCGIPTLCRVQEQVGGWEDDFGPSLVVLDGLENARPYPATPQDLVTFPNRITITRRALDEWRALEMSGYAARRRHAPTVVVWHDDGSQAHSQAIELLRGVAMVIIEANSGTQEGDLLTVSQRPHMNARFPRRETVPLR